MKGRKVPFPKGKSGEHWKGVKMNPEQMILGLTYKPFHYCPGCGHGIINRIIAEVISEMGLREQTICVFGIGCCNFLYQYLNMDTMAALHGRSVEVATGIKRSFPEKLVFTYQGDGDLASIGIGGIIHAGSRGEKITALMVNNSIYGMTGGQMGATTLIDQKTTTTPLGRNKEREGYPLKVLELLSQLEGVVFAERCAVHMPKHVRRAKQAIRDAFTVQREGEGLGFVEILSQCPVGLRLGPVEAVDWVEKQMVCHYPVGRIKG
jgi:2-oxoglutarate ferredoxin oxidoreductase subunit beta